MKIQPSARRFHLERVEDVTGVSGVGRVAEGMVASDGRVALRWLSACGSWVLYDNVDALVQVHGHGGATRVVWQDEEPRVAALRVKLEAIALHFPCPKGRDDGDEARRLCACPRHIALRGLRGEP